MLKLFWVGILISWCQFVPDPDVDTYMKAVSAKGQKTTLQTDHVLKVLGLYVYADTICGR
ncbi:hypothetical protein Patl1_24540 [Pistacia atlantica]|uniref:Uncharacterized protein n=1 Tax=Pistacia atlantica TaxID=434234 RepID=A0ACC1A1I9_9ROSI|nr:hypothetical protein Patl1_24540 [Pistacia atlantica]